MQKRFPTLSQWKQIFKVLTKREKTIFLVSLILAIASFGFLATSIYRGTTTKVPAIGGTYVEGVVGQPRLLNPIYGETNDTDRSIIDLVFSGLLMYDAQGNITTDLAESYTVSEDGRTYDFQLKNNILWHDGKPLTADDVVFTVKTIQNSDYKSPLRANWIDVTVEKTSETSVRFSLKTPYNSFIDTLTVKIIPKHIWEAISPENFTLSLYNLQPVGSGPFTFASLTTKGQLVKTLNLKSNRRYHATPSFIEKISFEFFEKKEDLIRAANNRRIDGFALATLDNVQREAEKEIRKELSQQEQFSDYSFSLPRYLAVFFNSSSSSLFSDKNIRKAFISAANKDELIQTISTSSNSTVAKVDSPLLPEFFGFKAPSVSYPFDAAQAKTLLDKAGYKDNGSGKRTKTVTKKPAFQFASYLKIGSQGNEVIQLQQCLARLDESFKTMLKSETNGKFGAGTDQAVTAFQKKYLPDKNPTGETGTDTRAKLNELCIEKPVNSQPLQFTITTLNQPQLIETAEILKQQWESVGATVHINILPLTELKQTIKSRQYDALLYGQALGSEPDLYPFWHSLQRIDPGLNLSYYENKEADKLLKEARETTDLAKKQQTYEKLQDIILQDAPALFLYNPPYVYWAGQNVNGIKEIKIVDPAKRFINVTSWYMETKRIWK